MKDFDLKKFLVENKLTTNSKLLSENTSAQFTSEDLDDFLIGKSLSTEDEITEHLPKWQGGDLEDIGYDVLGVWEGLEENYELKLLYAKESREETEANLVRVFNIIPLDKTEESPDIYFVETWNSNQPGINWDKVSGFLRGAAAPGVGGNGWFITKNLEAALETLLHGGAVGRLSKYDVEDHEELNPQNNKL